MYSLVAQTDEFILINKMPGFAVHKDQLDRGLAMQLKADLGLDALYPVHRLDKVTSGLMLFATNAQAAAELGHEFSEHRVEKFYLALSDKKPGKKQGAVVGDMERGRRSGWRLAKTRVRPAITQFFSTSLAPGIRLFLLKPLTGKTHQIRVALKSVGAPIIGDPIYHETTDTPADRTYLHAYSIGFHFRGQFYRYRQLPDQGALFDQTCRDLIEAQYGEPWALTWPKIKRDSAGAAPTGAV